MDSWMWEHYHLNHKTLKLFKPKCLTLSVRNITMLIDFEICKIWSVEGISYHSNIIPQFDYTIENYFMLWKNNDPRFDPRAPFYPICVYIHTHIHTYTHMYTHAYTYIYYYYCFCYCFCYYCRCLRYCYYIVYYSV